jgi:hypothetical protein
MGSALGALLLAAVLVPAPEDWRKETFQFPLVFAPKIPYQGSENVRFSPGWDRFGEETGFSYVFVWDLKAQAVATEDLEDHLETYFNGLMNGVAAGRKVEAKPIPAAAALHPMTAVRGWTRGWGAEVRTWNAFSKGEPLLLHGEVAYRECAPGRMQVFFAFSQARRDRPIWEQMRAIRQATECGDPESKS